MRLTLALLLTLATALPVGAQTGSDVPAVSFRPFFLVSADQPAARKTFEAVFDRPLRRFWGGGVQMALRSGFYVEVGASRFEETGQRAFIFNDETFRLAIPLTARITPLEVAAGYRFRVSPRLLPYAAGGITRYSYVETSEFADPGENVDVKQTGYLLLGGVEFRAHRWVGVGADVQYTQIKDVLGTAGISQEFGEDNLGGTAVRVKVLVGR